MVFADHVSQALYGNNHGDVSYNEFAKAFDTVDPLILLNKLEKFGFSVKLKNLSVSYFSNRQRMVFSTKPTLTQTLAFHRGRTLVLFYFRYLSTTFTVD